MEVLYFRQQSEVHKNGERAAKPPSFSAVHPYISILIWCFPTFILCGSANDECYLRMSSIKDDICKPASIFVFPALCQAESFTAVQPETVVIGGCEHNVHIGHTPDK